MNQLQRETLYRIAALGSGPRPQLTAEVMNSWLEDLAQTNFESEDDCIALQCILMDYEPDLRINSEMVIKLVRNCMQSGKPEVTRNLPVICKKWGSASMGEEITNFLNEVLQSLALHPDDSVAQNAKIMLSRGK